MWVGREAMEGKKEEGSVRVGKKQTALGVHHFCFILREGARKNLFPLFVHSYSPPHVGQKSETRRGRDQVLLYACAVVGCLETSRVAWRAVSSRHIKPYRKRNASVRRLPSLDAILPYKQELDGFL